MRIGIITGSGTYALPGFEDAGADSVDTPFGPARVTQGTFAGADVLHVARHGEGHAVLSSRRHPPGEHLGAARARAPTRSSASPSAARSTATSSSAR